MSPSRILIVKTTSMGDLVHALPVLPDIARHFPGTAIDWLAEEGFTALPALSPHVDEVIPVALRRWRKAWWSPAVRAERAAFVTRLRTHRYDVVIDLQGLIKSALLALRARGPVHGYGVGSGREAAASLLYTRRHRVGWHQPAVVRNRTLAACALGYTLDGPADFGLDAAALARDAPIALPDDYAAIMPSASRPTKLWPEERWQTVLRQLADRGIAARLFAGSEDELARAQRLAAGVPGAEALPRMGLREAAQVLAGARMVIGLDSGLTHLAGALGRPTIGIYCDYEPTLAPVNGAGYTASLGGPGNPPPLATVQHAVEQALLPR
jgi:heptosyltransferase-1